MSDVVFDEDPEYSARPEPSLGVRTDSFLGNLAIKIGLARDEQEARKALIIIAVFCLLVSVGIFLLASSSLNHISLTELESYAHMKENASR